MENYDLYKSVWYDFNPDLELPCRLIHPLQHQYIYQIQNFVIPDNVMSIIIFGGSLTLYCSEFSDIDLYVIVAGDADKESLQSVRDRLYDQCLKLGKHCDILVASEVEFREWRDDFASVDWFVQRDGVEIWPAKNILI